MSAEPGAGVLHPLVPIAIAVLVVNDHLLKARWPGVVTGKLSDVAGLAFFPLLLQAGWEHATRAAASRRALLVSVLATGLGFGLVNGWAPADGAYRFALSLLQWPWRALAAGALVARADVRHVADTEDLLALPALGLALAAGWARARSGRASPVGAPALPLEPCESLPGRSRSPWCPSAP